MSVNHVMFTGNLGKDPEFKVLGQSREMASFLVAINNGYKDKQTGEWVSKTAWVDCSAFGPVVNWIQEASKGDLVAVTGRLEQDEWNDKETGKKRTKLKVIVSTFAVLPKAEKKKVEKPVVVDDGDCPF